jgi:signal transduction histidine kinase
MFNSIFARLFTTCVLVILIALLIAVTLSAYLVRNDYLTNFSYDMNEISGEINGIFNKGENASIASISFLQANNQIANREDIAIALLDLSGNAILVLPKEYVGSIDTSADSKSFNNLKQLTLEGEDTAMIFQKSAISEYPLVLYATPLKDKSGQVLGGILIYKKLGELDILFDSMNKQFIASALFSFTVAFILIWAIASSITKPINRLTRSLKSVAQGDFSARVEYKGEDEISYLANSFNQMARDLEKHEALRNSFVGNVSHELRTPLTSINGFVEGIIDGTVPKQDRDKYLNIVLSETKRLNALITDLLELSKVESGKFPIHLSSFDINELLRITLLSFEKRIDEKRLNVVIDFEAENIYVAADKDKITQVVSNLLDNAIKFNEDKGKLGISAYLIKNKVTIKISNSGKPISQSDKDLIFERFYKADQSHNRKIAGTGIGLSLVKKILAQHDEKVWIEDTKKETTFCFTLKSAKDFK